MRDCRNDLDSLQESLLENSSYACVNTSYRKYWRLSVSEPTLSLRHEEAVLSTDVQ